MLTARERATGDAARAAIRREAAAANEPADILARLRDAKRRAGREA